MIIYIPPPKKDSEPGLFDIGICDIPTSPWFWYPLFIFAILFIGYIVLTGLRIL